MAMNARKARRYRELTGEDIVLAGNLEVIVVGEEGGEKGDGMATRGDACRCGSGSGAERKGGDSEVERRERR